MIDQVQSRFQKEFHPISSKFKVIPLTIKEAKESKGDYIYHPGVYIFWYGTQIIKVGRHLVNSRKRALEHIRDNTSNSKFEMKDFDSCKKDCGLVLINCIDPNDYHWVAAIEIYLERELKPKIKSQRTG